MQPQGDLVWHQAGAHIQMHFTQCCYYAIASDQACLQVHATGNQVYEGGPPTTRKCKRSSFEKMTTGLASGACLHWKSMSDVCAWGCTAICSAMFRNICWNRDVACCSISWCTWSAKKKSIHVQSNLKAMGANFFVSPPVSNRRLSLARSRILLECSGATRGEKLADVSSVASVYIYIYALIVFYKATPHAWSWKCDISPQERQSWSSYEDIILGHRVRNIRMHPYARMERAEYRGMYGGTACETKSA